MLVGSIVQRSRANGPGQRTVIWLQGCDRDCPGCCNPEFQPFDSSDAERVDPGVLAIRIAKVLKEGDVRGITFSGGEPLHPANRHGLFLCLLDLRQLHRRGIIPAYDVMVFTGYYDYEILSFEFDGIVPLLDMAICGPYEEQFSNPRGIIASSNQQIVRFNDKFDDVSDDELRDGDRIVEVHISGNGLLRVTGLQSVDDARRLVGL